MNLSSSISRNCGHCSAPASKKCSHCCKTFYCSIPCQKLHRSTHKPDCYPFIREENAFNKMDRVKYFATRTIPMGSVIYEETPLVIGPSATVDQATGATQRNIVCLGCNKVMNNFIPCPKCRWPLCSPDCEMISYHAQECEVLCKIGVILPSWGYSTRGSLHAVRILRTLLMKKENPAKFSQLLNLYQYVDPEDEVLFKTDFTNIIQFVRETCNLGSEFGDELITQIMKIDASFGGSPEDRPTMVTISPIHFSLHHSCIPNTRIIGLLQGPRGQPKPPRTLQFLAAVDIAPGEAIPTTPSDSVRYRTTQVRRKRLYKQLEFWCECQRCADPTELGTYFSAIKCPKCVSGHVIPVTPLVEVGPWACDLCTTPMTCDQVGKYTEDSGKLLAILEANLSGLGTFGSTSLSPGSIYVLSEMEQFLENYGPFLHPNHALTYNIKRYICAGFLTTLKSQGLSRSNHVRQKRLGMVEKMMDYAASGWKVTQVLFPGVSVFRGRMLLLLTLAKWLKLQELVISPGGLNQVEELAKECVQLKKELQDILTFLEKKDDRTYCEVELDWITTSVKELTRGNNNPSIVARILPIIEEE